MIQAVLYFPYATSYHEKTGGIITFTQFEEGGLVENEHNSEEDKSIWASIYYSYIGNAFGYRYISTKDFKGIQGVSEIHIDNNTIDNRLKICDRIKQTKIEWKEA